MANRRKANGPSRSRTDKAQEKRKRLLRAAARVVGTRGYAAASIARVAHEAKVAHGAMYHYFASRQELLDQLLPSLGAELLEHIGKRVHGSRSAVEREERQFRAFFEFLTERPEFYRILHEAEMYAPEGYERHFNNVEEGFVEALHRDWERGELPQFSPDELKVVGYIMMAARDYLMIRFGREGGKAKPLPEFVINAYMKLMIHGAYGGIDPRARTGPKSKTAPVETL